MIDTRQVNAAADRYKNRKRQRERNERLIKERRYLEIDKPEHVEKFLSMHQFSPSDAHQFLSEPVRGIPVAQEPVAGHREPFALERVLGTNDLMRVAFLEQGLQVARSVGRIWVGVSSGSLLGYGTGFLISPRLLMTNHHVLEEQVIARQSLVEFDYQIGLRGDLLPTTTFAFEPDVFFFADEYLDYAVVAVQKIGSGGRKLTSFGWNPLIEQEGKAIISQWLNIIQHPNGEHKQLGLRENQFVDRLDDFLHYKTDTAPGSSGSPVFNDHWQVVALHHSGVWDTNGAGQVLALDGQVWHESMGEHRIKWIANEGARISKIVKHLRMQPMSEEQKQLFNEALSASPQVDNQPEKKLGEPPLPRPDNAQVTDAQVTVAPDGSAMWSIPLTVSVRLGVFGTPAAAAPLPTLQPPFPTPKQPVSPPVDRSTAGVLPANDLNAVLAAAKRALGSRADVLNVRLGYVFKDGWITNERALVVTVRHKQTPGALQQAQIPPLPDTFQGIPIEVTNPSIADMVRLDRGPAVAKEAFSDVATLPEEIIYRRPEGVSFNKVTDTMRVVAHVSPDAGWSKLSEFLQDTRKRLVVGMFDFGAPHIVEVIEQVGSKRAFQTLKLVMQRGESVGTGTKVDDLRDDQVVNRLRSALGSKFENTWVKIGRVNGWVSSSYHIKVAVRDEQAFWLSSGNWQSSNQPKADPLSESPPHRRWLDTYNREWHAIVEHTGLAQVFETCLLHDLDHNISTTADEVLDLPDLLLPESFFLPSPSERAAAIEYFQPFDQTRTFTVTPLLTPDNYHEHVLALVTGASEELLIQNQTFNAPKDGHEKLRQLIDAVLDRHRSGVQVRVIFRLLDTAKARETLEQLKDYGFDTEMIRVQRNCHTKGIVVDRKQVLLGSQNWSNDGISVNRDASLLFEDEPLARYFAQIFDHDWNQLARKNIGSEWRPIELTSAGDLTPPGMIRLTWKDYMEMG